MLVLFFLLVKLYSNPAQHDITAVAFYSAEYGDVTECICEVRVLQSESSN